MAKNPLGLAVSTRKFNKDFYKIIVEAEGKDPLVVAVYEAFEGDDLATVGDVRLTMHSMPNKCFIVGASEYISRYTAPTLEAFNFAKSIIAETLELPGLAPLELAWCTYSGLVVGRRPPVDQVFPQSKAEVYHTRKEGLAHLSRILLEWQSLIKHVTYEELTNRELFAKYRINNPRLQHSEATIQLEIFMQDLDIASGKQLEYIKKEL